MLNSFDHIRRLILFLRRPKIISLACFLFGILMMVNALFPREVERSGKMKVKFNKVTWTGLLMLGLFIIGFLFSLIAYATEGWCDYKSAGTKISIGLWNGCFKNATANKMTCSPKIFHRKEFEGGSEWFVGARVLMTLSLVFQMFQLIALICYVCVYQLLAYRDKLTAINIGLIMIIGLFNVISLLLFGSEASNLGDSSLGWSFGLAVVGTLALLVCGLTFIVTRWLLLRKDRSI